MAEPTPTPELSDCEKAQQSVINLLMLLLSKIGASPDEINSCIVK
ncbi:MAG: hypothetical protein PHE67_05735 [Campylobacterales bacterium]|nr:hypothetical protein [Campylobacterales bacterium]